MLSFKYPKLLILIVSVLLSSFVHSEELCEKLISFSSNASTERTLEVKITNDWNTFSKSCEHNNTAEGKAFCDYLIKNTSSEFMALNLSRVLSCSGSVVNFGTASIDKINGDLTLHEVPQLDQDISIYISFSIGQEDVKDFLRIQAKYELLE